MPGAGARTRRGAARLLIAGLVPMVVACSSTTPEPGGLSSPKPSASAAPSGAQTAAPSPSPQAVAAGCGTETTPVELKGCWERMFPVLDAAFAPMATEVGASWTTPRMAVFGTRPPKNPCHEPGDGGVGGSFYCAGTSTVYLSTWEADRVTTDYVRQARRVDGVLEADAKRAGVPVSTLRKGRPGQGQATIEAHEMAHHLLVRTGVQALVRPAGRQGDAGDPALRRVRGSRRRRLRTA